MKKFSPELIRLLVYAVERDVPKGKIQGAEGFSRSLALYINSILEDKEIQKPRGWDNNILTSDWDEFLNLIKTNIENY